MTGTRALAAGALVAFALAVAVMADASAAPAPAPAKKRVTTRKAHATGGSLHASAVCGACHGPLRDQWAASGHATAWTNPVFQAFLAEAKEKHGAGIQAQCVTCHAPLAHVGDDPAVAATVSKEGVACQFCHAVSAVDPSTQAGTYTFDRAHPNLLRGPYKDSNALGAHQTAYSPLHGTAEFCASCHSYKHPVSGVLIEGTYLAWKRFSGAEYDMECQDCHMPPTPGQASTVSKVPRASVNAHTFAGPRTTPSILDEAAVLTGKMENGKLRLDVENAKAGHSLPGGGNSFRTVTLDVTFQDAAGATVQSFQAERFGTEFADAGGNFPIPKWNAHSVARATEIGPDSTRTVTCDVPPGAARAEAVLTYYPIHPAYRAMLERRGVDLSSRAPVVLARATVDVK